MVSSERARTEFRLLGPVEAVRDGVPLPLGGKRQRTLLALLLLEHGRPVSSDRLIEDLWHGDPPAGAGKTLRAYVSRLRSALGDSAVFARPPGYVLEVEPERLDAHHFEELFREGHDALARGAAGLAADRLRAALALWRGRALSDVADGGVLALEAQRLDELRLACLEERIEAELVLGRHADLVAELERLVQEEPLRERLWRQLVVALYRSGRQADALAGYRRARTLLAEELGLEPSEELRELERAVLRHEVAQAPPAKELHNLPAQVMSFIGREQELADIERLLRKQRLLTLTGVGGAGKTRLALQAATGQIGALADGVWLVDLTAVSDPELVPSAVARTIRIAERPDISVLGGLLDHLRTAELLLVLDNCEHVAEACGELVHEVLRACPHVRVMATSRVPLGIAGEANYLVEPLPAPGEGVPAEAVEQFASVRLFLDRARAVRRDLTADTEGLTTVARICREVDGLPLAIELAAGRAKALSVDEIAGRLGDRFRFLRSWRRMADPRHQTLRATMDWSYDLLSEDERALLRRLAAFAGGFTLEAVCGVCLKGDDACALERLSRLVEASLVVAEDRHGHTRYRLLETIREYATERLDGSGEADEFRRRHAEHFLDLARQRGPEERRKPEILALLDAERDNLNGAVRWALESGSEVALPLAAELWEYWLVRGDRRHGLDWLEDALALSQHEVSPTRADALAGSALLARLTGDFGRAQQLAKEGVAVGRAAGAPRAVIISLNVLITLAGWAGDYEQARARCDEALAVARNIGNAQLEAFALFIFAEAALHTNRYSDARDVGGRALELFRAVDDRDGIALTLARLGMADVHEDRPEQALSRLGDALEYAKELGTPETAAWCCDGLAVISVSRGDPIRGARLLGAAEALRRAAGGMVQPAEAAAREHALSAARRTLATRRWRRSSRPVFA